jgi:hypothetical protein
LLNHALVYVWGTYERFDILLTQEQIIWAVEEKADYIVAETFNDFGEALLALETIKEFGNGKHI